MTPITLNLEPIINLSHEQFYALCMANKDVAMERNPRGELIIMAPVGGGMGRREADYITDLTIWNRATKLGVVFSSSTVFNLPNGGDRSPDVAWVSRKRWDALSPEEQERFPPLCTDFVMELRSRSDRLGTLQDKMREYLASGLRLGWLINHQDQVVEIYRLGQEVDVVTLPATLSGEDVLPGFTMEIG